MRIDPCQNKCNVISIWQVTIKFQIYDLVLGIFICYLSKLWAKLIAFYKKLKMKMTQHDINFKMNMLI